MNRIKQGFFPGPAYSCLNLADYGKVTLLDIAKAYGRARGEAAAPHPRLSRLQRDAARILLGAIEVHAIPKRMNEVLDHLGAVPAFQFFLEFLGFEHHRLAEDPVLRESVREAFGVVQSTEQLAERYQLSDLPIFRAAATRQASSVEEMLQKFHLAVLLRREVASLSESARQRPALLAAIEKDLEAWDQITHTKVHAWRQSLRAPAAQ